MRRAGSDRAQIIERRLAAVRCEALRTGLHPRPLELAASQAMASPEICAAIVAPKEWLEAVAADVGSLSQAFQLVTPPWLVWPRRAFHVIDG